jgi:CheY-like chemotaxis protein
LSVLSHELRTPLTPALSAISFIEHHHTAPSDLREQIGMIRRNIETEARLVDDLLDLTRIARGKIQLHFEIVDAHAVARDVVRMFQPEVDDKALAVTVALRAKEFAVWADPGRFQQVLLNLMSNAVKFSNPNGSISLSSRNDDGKLVFEVSDTGVGIEPEVVPRLFSAFEQGDPSVTRRFGGLGLGLSIVRSLINMHGGSIAASSGGREKGATFTLSIPTVPASSGEHLLKQKPDRTYGGLRILLVEDHTDTRLIMEKLLSSFGCAVTTAASVHEAIELSREQSYDLLVSDIGLPDGTGLDVMRYLRQRQPIRGIALSGYGQDDDLRRSREEGFEQHLVKPINFQVLQDVLRKVAN